MSEVSLYSPVAVLQAGSARVGHIPDDRSGRGCHESRRCSRDTYPESHITKYTSIRKKTKGTASIPAENLLHVHIGD